MGWRTVADARDYSRARGSAYVVLVMLAERAPDETRVARPGLKLLAIESRVDRSTVQRALSKLEELGEIEAVAYRSGGHGKATEWAILVGPEMYETTIAEEQGLRSATPAKGGTSHNKGGTSHEKGRTLPPQPERTEDEPNDGSPKGSHPDLLGALKESLSPARDDEEVFEFWRRVFGRDGKTKFTPGRRRAVRARLAEGYGVDRLKRAILGCAGSRFHVENGHTDLTLICRNGEKVEAFESRPEPPNGLAIGVAGAPNGPAPQRRENDGVPEISLDGGQTWESDYDEVLRRRSERGSRG